MNGRCRHPLNEGRRCTSADCRWFLPLLDGCRGCGLKESCGSFEEVDESGQLELDWNDDDAAKDGCDTYTDAVLYGRDGDRGGGEADACG